MMTAASWDAEILRERERYKVCKRKRERERECDEKDPKRSARDESPMTIDATTEPRPLPV